MSKAPGSINSSILLPNNNDFLSQDLTDFLRQKLETFNFLSNQPKLFFPRTNCLPVDPTSEENKKINKKLTKKLSKFYSYLFKNPHLCSYVVRTIPEETLLGKNPNGILSEIFTFGILSNSIKFIRIFFSYTKSKNNFKISRSYSKTIRQRLNTEVHSCSLHIDFSSRSNGYPFIIDDISCASAFAASQSEVYIGQRGGLIHVLSVSAQGKPMIKFNLWKAVGSSPYSLCWVHERLFMITEKQAFMINVSTNEVTEIPQKPDKLVPPVCTDGHLFYSIRVLVRKGKLTIFSFSNGQFNQENKVVLQGSIADSYSELQIPFVTDGVRMTFATPRGKSIHFIEFSLENGNLINDLTRNCSTIINSWCIRPYAVEHVALTNSDISFYRESLQIPKWLLGIPVPQAHGTMNPIFIMLNGLYYGSCLFPDEDTQNINEMLQSFLEIRNEHGIYISGMLLMDNLSDKMSDKSLSLIVEVFEQFEVFNIRRFCLFVFLSGFSKVKNKEIYREKNILNMFLEQYNDYDFIWLFPNYLDCKTFKLSKIVIDKIIPYVSENVRSFSNESIAIMNNCCINYIDKKIEKGETDDIITPLQAIFHTIVQKVLYYMPSLSDPSDFIYSPHFTLWKNVLKLFSKINMKQWSRYAESFYPDLIELVFQMPKENPNNNELFKMLNRTLYIFLGMLLSSPYQHDRKIFSSVEEYYSLYPDPFNRYSKNLDQYIFNLLSVAYDVKDQNEFNQYFVTLRKRILFDNNHTENDFEPLLNVSSLSAPGLLLYLKTKDVHDLCSVSTVSLMSKFIKAVAKKVETLTIPQQFVFSLYSSFYSDRTNEFLSVDEKVMQKFMKCFSFPYFFPPEVLSHYKFEAGIKGIENISEDFLLKFFDALSVILSQVDDLDLFVNSFLDRARDPSIFANTRKEPEHFKASILCYLAVKNGVPVDLNAYDSFIEYFISGSTRVIGILMKIVMTMDLNNNTENMDKMYEFLLNCISNYILDSNNYFLMLSDSREPLQSLFIIISSLKQLFNYKESKFHLFLDQIAQNPDKSILFAPAIFAVLQNSLEFPRSDINVHFRDINNIEISGKIVKMYANTIEIEIPKHHTIETKHYLYTQVSSLWCEPQTKVDLSTISDFSFYFALFSSTTDFSPSVNVFRYASLLEFIKIPAFYSYCSLDFFRQNTISKKWTRRIKIEDHLSDFFYALMINTKNTSPISFIALGNELKEIPLSQNNNMNELDVRKKNFSGMLMTMKKEKIFVSSPFHPMCKFTLTLQIYPSRHMEKDYSLVSTVFAYSKTLDTQFESKTLKIRGHETDIVVCRIEYTPEDGVCNIYVADELKRSFALSPAIVLFYFEFQLSPSTLIDYKFDTDSKMYFHEKNPDSSLFTMEVSKNNTIIPFTDSSIFHYIELCRTSQCLIDCFMELIEVQISESKHQTLKSDSLLYVLATINGAPYGLPLNLMQMHLESIFNFSEKSLFEFVKNMSVDYEEMISHCQSLIENLTKLGYNNSNNGGPLIVPAETALHVKNCTIITETKIAEYGCSKQQVMTTSQTCIIPNNSFENSFLQVFSFLYFIISLKLRDHIYDFSDVIRLLDMIPQKVPALADKVREFKETIELLAPQIPSDTKSAVHRFADFNPLSFLLPESIIHRYPRKFLAQALANNIVDPILTTEKSNDVTPHLSRAPMTNLANKARSSGSIKVAIAREKDSFSNNLQNFMSTHVIEKTQKQYVLVSPRYGKIKVTDNTSKAKTIELSDEKQYTFVSPKFNVEYENVKTKCAIYILPDINQITEQLQIWRPHNSHQLICAFTKEGGIDKESFMHHPLSSKFSYETAQFVFYLTSLITNDNIFDIKRHIIHTKAAPQPKKKNLKLSKSKSLVASFSIFTEHNDMSDTASQGSPSLNSSDIPLLMDNEMLMDISFCKLISDTSHNTLERVTYATTYSIPEYAPVDSDSARIMNELPFYEIQQKYIFTQLFETCIGNRRNSYAEKWLRSFLEKSPTQVILHFIEYANGKYGLHSLRNSPIYLWFSEKKEDIASVPEEEIVIIGEFESEEQFVDSLKTTLQKFIDSRFTY